MAVRRFGGLAVGGRRLGVGQLASTDERDERKAVAGFGRGGLPLPSHGRRIALP